MPGISNPRVLYQLQAGKLVCPKTRRQLFIRESDRRLVDEEGSVSYRVAANGVPMFVSVDGTPEFTSSDKMLSEYTPESLTQRMGFRGRLREVLFDDYRSEASKRAFDRVFCKPELAEGQEVFLSVGGGPGRPHPALVNLNIGPFPNVDIVADAHCLPYADGSVDAIFCEAVLEHLYAPIQAVQEMCRVLKPGGEVFASTPFLQAYHGYPHHYQNFTLTGHQRLFSDRGLEVVEAGTCVGPVFMWLDLTYHLLAQYAPLGKHVSRAWLYLSTPLRPLDRRINRSEGSHMLASTTYLVARKPGGA
jgi:SAM-dependent methyltransferase